MVDRIDRKDLNRALSIIRIVVALLPAKQRLTPSGMLPQTAACAVGIRQLATR